MKICPASMTRSTSSWQRCKPFRKRRKDRRCTSETRHISSLWSRNRTLGAAACINLIASENVTSNRVRGIMGSDFAHRYAEGHPGERYYQGTEIIDEIESLLKQHMKALFRLQARRRAAHQRNHRQRRGLQPLHPPRRHRHGELHARPAGTSAITRPARSANTRRTSSTSPSPPDGWHIDVDQTLDLAEGVRAQGHDHGQEPLPVPRAGEGDRARTARRGIHLIYDAAHVLGLVAGEQFQDPAGRRGAHRHGEHAQDFLRISARRDPFKPRRRGMAQDRQGRVSRVLLQPSPGDPRCADICNVRGAGVRRRLRAAGGGECEGLCPQALRARIQGAGGEVRVHREPPGGHRHDGLRAAARPLPAT